MQLFIDSADINEIKKLYHYFPVDGVTTNPSLLAKSLKIGQSPMDLLKEIREFIGEEDLLFVQVLSTNLGDIVKEIEAIEKALGEISTFIKVPATLEGIAALKELVYEEYNLTATAVYSIQQAILAAKAGADYIAPYVNRMDNLGIDGVGITKKINNILKVNDFDSKVLAASFKNSQQVINLVEDGVEALTLSPDVFMNFIKNPIVDEAALNFVKDIENKTFKNVKMSDFND